MNDFQVKFMDVSWISYPEYKYSGIEWIGEIPEGWKVKKLKLLTKKVVDGTHFTPTYVNEGIPFLRVTDIQNKEIDLESVKRIPKIEHIELTKRCRPERGDLLLSKNGTIGIPYVVTWDWEFSIFVSLCLIKFKQEMNVNYSKYFFLSDQIDEQITMGGKKNTVTNLHLDKIKEFLFIVPPLPEQQAIANFLDRETSRIDTLIEKKQHFIELLEEKRAALISHIVTKGLDPNVPMKDSGICWIGEIPETWEINKLKHSASINPNVLPENTDPEFVLKYIDIGNVGLGKIVDPPKEMKFKDAPSRARKTVQENDIIISTVRTYLKAILHIINPEPNLIVSTGFAVLRPRPFVNHRYLFYLIRSNQFIYSVMSHSEGVSYPAINSSSLGDLPICYPTLPEQQAIASYLDREAAQFDAFIEKIKKSIEFLKEYRTALISDVVTGKIDVRGTICE